MTIDELYNTSANQWILLTFNEIYDELVKRNAYTNHDLTDKEIYIETSFKYHSCILQTCDQLERITVFLKRFDKKFFSSNNITQSDFIQYHLEMYLSKLYTLFDLLLKYTNIVFQLNIKPSKCSYQIIKQKLITQKETLRILDNIHCNLKDGQFIRNQLIHENLLQKQGSFDRLSSEELLWCQYDKLDINPDISNEYLRPKHIVDFLLKRERTKIINLIQSNNAILNEYINIFNDNMIETIKNKLCAY
jgi:hypothetical protein